MHCIASNRIKSNRIKLKSHGIPHNLQFILSIWSFVFSFMLFALRSNAKQRTKRKKNIARGKYYDRRHIHAIVTQWICVHLFGIYYGNVNGDVRVVAQQTLGLVNFGSRHTTYNQIKMKKNPNNNLIITAPPKCIHQINIIMMIEKRVHLPQMR